MPPKKPELNHLPKKEDVEIDKKKYIKNIMENVEVKTAVLSILGNVLPFLTIKKITIAKIRKVIIICMGTR